MIIIAKAPKDSAKTKGSKWTTNTMKGYGGGIGRNVVVKEKIPFVIGNTVGSAIIECNVICIHIEVDEGGRKNIRSNSGKC